MKYFVLALAVSLAASFVNAAGVQITNAESYDDSEHWSPEAFEALELFLAALDESGYGGKSLNTYKLLSESDRNAISKAEYLKSSFPPQTDEIADLIDEYVTHELRGFQSDNLDSLTFIIENTYPKIEFSLVSELMDGWSPDTNTKIVEYLSARNIPILVLLDEYTMIKEEGSWKVYMGMANKMQANEIYDNSGVSDSLLNSYTGVQLLLMKDALLYSKAELGKVLALDKDHYSASADLKKINGLLEKSDDFEKYRTMIELTNLKVAKSTLDEDGIFGSIKNTSNESFDKVQLTFYYLDSNGKAIHEETYHPILVSKYSLGPPLKANYTKEFGIKAKTPHGWAKRIKAVISDIEVSEK